MVILTIFLLVGMVIAGPVLTGQVGSDAHEIDLALPIAINGSSSIALTSLQALGGLVVLIGAAIVIVGGGIMFVFSRLEAGTAVVTASDSFQEAQTALKQLDADKVNQLREGRQTDGVPDHQRPGWSAASSSLVVILFAVFFGMLLNYTLIPHSQYVVNGRTASGISATLVGLVFTSFFIIVVRRSIANAQRTGGSGAWDTVWVTASGMLIVGIGLTLLLYYSGNPEVERAVNSAVPVVGGFVTTALLILALRVQPQKFSEIDKTDTNPIPWDSLWVLITGLLIVGLGIGYVIYLNTPG